MIRQAIIKLANKKDLTYDEAAQVMNEMMSGETTQVQIAAFLTALAMKGETIEEITGCAAAMRAKGVRLLHNVEALEIVGTGGDQSNSFNISTTSALVIAAGGVPVAKHGNRAASSKSGAADCLEALGVNIMITPGKSTKLLENIGICFLFAQNYHASMKYVAPVRKELGIRTVFNLLGPLSNPAGATMELMGVYDESLVKRGMVVYGQDKLDEISMSAPTTVCEINNGNYRSYVIQPEDFGLKRCTKDELVGGTAVENAEITKGILSGQIQGAKRDAVCINAGAALYIGGKAESIGEGIKLAQQLIDSGAAMKKLEEFVEYSNQR